MISRRECITRGLRLAAGLFAAPALLSAVGCGGSMAGSATSFSLNGITAYGGNPTVEILPTTGGTTTGAFTIDNASSITRVGETIFLEASYFAEIRNVNPLASQTAGTFSVEWAEVPSESGGPLRSTMNNSTGTTFTGYTPSASPNVRVSGVSGNFLTVATPGPITFRLRVTLHASDGSSRRKDFFTTLNIAAPVGV